ncbi:hypothetical protein HLI03_13720 [Rhizobium laguerreae]|uniref:hypothetical protein n=1 Tax=Rhizobium TaxID=379 RepID=UPI001389EC7C|nr:MULTISPECIES: hypothetical protein [Rhizobium]MBY5367431.1 hypothetical protein [Rhizobium leguminosarum]MBY5449923.1 hypothetical protein [Rhizobium leguminosarum]NDK48255.1 hypothetical protein [Rhizobium laguerreae]NNH42702.1 hypothetical protein [Rhizobium laguerreae]
MEKHIVKADGNGAIDVNGQACRSPIPDPADTISIELMARDDSCISEVDLMRKYPEFDGADA